MKPVDEVIYEDPTDEYNKNFEYHVEWSNDVVEVDTLPDVGEPGVYYHVPNGYGYNTFIWTGNSWIDLGDGIEIDSAMSSTSTNPVQNKVIYETIDDISDQIGDLSTLIGEGVSG